MSENEAKARAEKIVDEKIGFYHHLYSYIVVNVILAVINKGQNDRKGNGKDEKISIILKMFILFKNNILN